MTQPQTSQDLNVTADGTQTRRFLTNSQNKHVPLLRKVLSVVTKMECVISGTKHSP